MMNSPSCFKAKNTLKYAHGNQAKNIQFLKQTLFFCHHQMWIGLHSYYAIRTAFNAFFIFQLILFSQKSINALCQNFCNNLFCHSQVLAAFGCHFLLLDAIFCFSVIFSFAILFLLVTFLLIPYIFRIFSVFNIISFLNNKILNFFFISHKSSKLNTYRRSQS